MAKPFFQPIVKRFVWGSIAARLFWLSALWLVVALGATAILLTDLYSRALDRSLVETINFNIETLVAQTLTSGSPADVAIAASDPRFARPVSGWYWKITDGQNQLLNASESMFGSVLPSIEGAFDAQNTRTSNLLDGFGTRIVAIERKIDIAGEELSFFVTGNADDIAILTDQFRQQALFVLIAIGAMLAIMTAIVARVALRPVGRLRTAVENIREGEVEQVEGEYPAELTPLADEVNELLRSNSQILERARGQVGNLAHGLKTPLAVLRNEAADQKGDFAEVARSEIERMTNIVTTYLARARLAARTAVIGKRSNATAILNRLVRVLQKLNEQQNIELRIDEEQSLWFRGEDSDLEEITGNLLDNACKWSRGEIRVHLQRAKSDEKLLQISIEDNGQGLNRDETQAALRRGIRLDEKVAGSGLGLDIVKELVDIYGGKLEMTPSEMGGLRVIVLLPAANPPN